MSDERMHTGVPGLDPIVGGGLIPDALYLVKGAPGSGKTTIGLQFLLEGARRGEKCLYLGLSETRGQLGALATSFGWSLDGIEIHEMRRRGEGDAKRAAYTVFSPTEVELEEIAREIMEASVSHSSELAPERVLVLTPTGRDATMVEERLVAAGFACEVCSDVDALLSALHDDAGAALIAQEALGADTSEALLAALDAQEPWSDLPVLFLSLPLSKRAAHAHPTVSFLGRANVTLLQRPLKQHLFLSAVRSALRARRRQYQMRDLHRELSHALQLGDMFVSILGHDLRTPLGSIRMGAEIIVKTAEDARSLRPAGRILSSVDRMTRMIEQLLDLAQVRQGNGFLLGLAPSDFGDIARQVLQELADANPQARIDVSSSGRLGGRWDPDRLGQVVSNLVGNSVQHGTAGSPITVELDGTRPDLVRLSVANAGVIPVEAIPTLFEPFKHTTKTRGSDKGLGLGLFIAREIILAHGGDLVVRTINGITIFETTLPRDSRSIATEVLALP